MSMTIGSPSRNGSSRGLACGWAAQAPPRNNRVEGNAGAPELPYRVLDFAGHRRLAHARLLDDAQLVKLFDVLAARYADRNGGYTRIIKTGPRASDASPMAIIEFVDRDVSAKGQDSGPVMTDEDFDEAA